MMHVLFLLPSENCDGRVFGMAELRALNLASTEGREGTMRSKNRKGGK